MRISGFTMCRNASVLHYPVCESIKSLLPVVDEMVVAIGKGDTADTTLEDVRKIGSPKIRIVETEWDLQKFPNGMENAHQTDIAKSHCTGDWLIYLQADEILHEQDYPAIRKALTEEYNNTSVEAFVLDYLHFWGDYEHLVTCHGWYQNEIRIVRNLPEIHSWESAQSFRWIEGFDGISYRSAPNARKLKAKKIDANIYHYGWVRPPAVMTKKMNALDAVHSHKKKRFSGEFEYGNLSNLDIFRGTHPIVITTLKNTISWSSQLCYTAKKLNRTHRFKHERLKYKIMHLLEKWFNGGRHLFAFKNFDLIE